MPRAGLTPAAVTRLALELLDESGSESLTLKNVAARAGVATPSLYKHVQSIDHLKDLMAITVLDEAAAEIGAAVMGRSGREALEAFLTAYRGYALRLPHRWSLIEHPASADPAVEAAATRLVEVAYAVVRGFGLADDGLIDAVRTLRAAVTGFIALEQGGGFQLGRDPGESFRYLVSILAAGLAAG
ncbi:TetR/AcrR family transcriptional regulator [Actinospica robiniae]|uniref:TetR/AcrR family transcriptional regulator n=1 Tax=Actinospica robiniae TaxID=304901 RepID=UPI00040D8339|nr:TetR/AcrR family transcriptional regulator [Actinospica robiniae]